MVKTKFKIKYTISELEFYKRTEATLLREGWKKTNYTYGIPGRIEPDDVFFSWFVREWK